MKKHLLKWMSGVCMAIGFSLPLPASAQYESQKISFRPVKKWSMPAVASAEKNSPSYTGIFRFQHPLSDQTLEKLARMGIGYGKKLSDRICILRIPGMISPALLKSAGIREYSDITPVQRCEKLLFDKLSHGDPDEIGETEIQILPHPCFPQSEIQAFWKPEWGEILKIWPGKTQKWTIKANPKQIRTLLNQPWVFRLEETEGPDIPFDNQISASDSRSSFVQNGIAGLTGEGISVGIGDGGRVESHMDFQGRQYNLTANKIPSFADHQDHVTGTIGGAGLLQACQKGIAPKAQLYNLQSNSVLSMIGALENDYGIHLTNNSYGANLDCGAAGNYNATSAFLDDQAYENPDILHVFASGNQGSVTCGNYPSGYFNLAEGYPVSKNCLTVGAVDGLDGGTWFSSKGPTRDGRVKPEIVAMGNDLISTVPSDGYGIKSGTSMAAPGVTGALALLSQHYKNLHNQTYPESALLKALICNSADDLGNPQVDFAFGYGRLNTRKAKNILDLDQIRSQTISSQGTQSFNLVAPPSARTLKVMLAWTDPAGLAGGTVNLVHDLDMKVIKAGGQIFLPWILNANPSAALLAATRGEDHFNNMEQVSLPVSPGESVVIQIKSGPLAEQYQKYWIVYEWIVPELVLTFPLSGTQLASGQNYTFRWDLQGLDATGLILETSTDTLAGWETFQSPAVNSPQLSQVQLSASIPEKRFFRMKAILNQGSFFSNAVEILIAPKISLQTDICKNHVRLSWPALPGASDYEIYRLKQDEGRWISMGKTINPYRIVSGLEDGSRNAFAVKPWFSDTPGILSDGKMVISGGSGSCPWASDLGLIRINAPGNARQFCKEMSKQNPPSLLLRNVGNTAFQNKPVSFFAQLNNGTIKQTNRSVSLAPGDSSVVVLSNLFIPSNAGNYFLRVWFSFADDANRQNDTLKRTFRQVTNPPTSLPVTFDFENLPEESRNEPLFSHDSLSAIDFNSKNGGRMSSSITGIPLPFGGRCLKLDKAKIDGKSGVAEIIITLNMSQIAPNQQLAVDFDWLPLGNIPEGSSLSFRVNDGEPWVEWIRFWQQDYTPGLVKKFNGLDLTSALNGQTPGSSFQFRFSFQGTMSADVPDNGQGYAFDNLKISKPPKDMVMKKLLSPSGGCVVSGEQKKVKIRILNSADSVCQHIRVGYFLPATGFVEEIIPFLAAGDSLDFEFANPLPEGLLGQQDFKVWVRGANDQYPVNDTTRNISMFFSPGILSYPYYENFEQGSGFWRSYGQNNVWQWGKPAENLEVIDTAANGLRIWATNLSGPYPAGSLSYLESPCFDLSEAEGMYQFSFNGNFKIEQDYDYLWVEASEDGHVWKKVGMTGAGTQWYNHGSHQWSGSSGGWTVHSIGVDLSQLVSKSAVRFRFGFSSDISNQMEGIGLDDIHLEPRQLICADSSFFSPVADAESDNWLWFGNPSGVVAEVEALAGSGSVQLKMKNTRAGIRYHDSIPYLSRNFLIQAENPLQQSAKVRLYLSLEELQNLQLADPGIRSFQDLGVYQYSGQGEDLELENNPPLGGQFRFIRPADVLKVPTAGGYFLEFTVSFFSEFYISGRSLEPDEAVLQSGNSFFSASRTHEKEPVKLTWAVPSGSGISRFELAFSCDGKSFSDFRTEYPSGENAGGQGYQAFHMPPACNGENLMYRLRQFNFGKESAEIQSFAQIKNNNKANPFLIVENPASSVLKLIGLNADSRVSIFNYEGKNLISWDWKINEATKDIGSLPPGLYFVAVENALQSGRLKLIKL